MHYTKNLNAVLCSCDVVGSRILSLAAQKNAPEEGHGTKYQRRWRVTCNVCKSLQLKIEPLSFLCGLDKQCYPTSNARRVCARFTFQLTASLRAQQHLDAFFFVLSVSPPHTKRWLTSIPAFSPAYSSNVKIFDPRKFLQTRTAPSVPSYLVVHLDTTSFHLPVAGNDTCRQIYSLPGTRTSGSEYTTPSSELASELPAESI